MFGFFKNLKRGDQPKAEPNPAAATAAAPPAETAVKGSPPAPPVPTPPAPAAPSPSVAASLGAASKARTERVLLSLKTITDRFSPQQTAVLTAAPAATVVVALPVEDLLTRMARGKVEVSIGELRRVAPVNTFVADTSHDGEMVELPLPELIAKLDPLLFKTRSQQRVDVPQQFGALFARRAGNAVQTPPPLPEKSDAAAAAGAEDQKEKQKEKLKKSGIVEASSELQALLAGIKKEPSAAPVVQIPVRPPAPAVPPAQPKNVPQASGKPVNLMAPKPAPVAPAPQRRQPIVDAPAIKLREAPPQDRPPAPPKPAPLEGNISLPLPKVSAGWPETIREETAAYPSESKIEFPAAELGAALRLGKVSVPWQRLRAMIVPKVEKKGDSLYDDAVIELPLPVVAPLFMAATRTASSPQQRVTVDENLPVLFAAKTTGPAPAKPAQEKPTPVSPSAPATQQQQALKLAPKVEALKVEALKVEALKVEALKVEALKVEAPKVEAPKVEAPKVEAPKVEAPKVEAPKPAEASQPGALGLDDRIPSELIARACALNGVAGSVITLADGFLVAATVPPEFKAETIAAFLPQVFSRLEQAAGTMQIGELQTLMFTAGNRPWQIWRAGSLFFAAVGRPNELLPGAQLKIIAAQLARQVKA